MVFESVVLTITIAAAGLLFGLAKSYPAVYRNVYAWIWWMSLIAIVAVGLWAFAVDAAYHQLRPFLHGDKIAAAEEAYGTVRPRLYVYLPLLLCFLLYSYGLFKLDLHRPSDEADEAG